MAMLTAILFLGQVCMAFLPNIEVVTLLVILYTQVYRKKVFFIIYAFALLEGVFYGFGLWWFNYLYVWSILALIVLVFVAPLIKGVFGGAVGVIVTLALLPFLLTFFVGAGSVVLVIAAVMCVIIGIPLTVSMPPAGTLTIGVGCLMMALGLLFLALTVWFGGKMLPAILRKFTGFCSNIINGRKEGKA